MKVKITITLTDDDTEEVRENQVEIEESIPGGFQNLDKWEASVQKIGYKSMRELFNLHSAVIHRGCNIFSPLIPVGQGYEDE
jgi:hypothetical protein